MNRLTRDIILANALGIAASSVAATGFDPLTTKIASCIAAASGGIALLLGKYQPQSHQ